MNPDSYAYIPFAITGILAFVILLLTLIIMIRKTAKVSFVIILSLLCVIGSVVYVLLQKNIFYFSLIILLAVIIILPYCVMMAFGKKKEYLTSKKNKADESNAIKASITYKPEDLELLNINKEFALRTSSAFSQSEGLNQLLDFFSNKLKDLTNADGAAILLVDDFDDVISLKKCVGSFPPPYKLPENVPHKKERVEMSMRYAQFPLSENIFGEIATSGKAEIIKDSSKEDRIFKNGDEDFLKCGSYIFVPLTVFDTVIGEIAVAKDFGKEPFTDEEFETAKKLSDLIATNMRAISTHNDLIEHTGLAKESEIASRVQKSILLPKVPAIHGLSLGVFFEAAENICGDYYDIMISRKDRISFVMADVAGKSMNSMVIMLMIRAMLRLIINTTQTAGTILSWTNRGIASEYSVDHFASVSLLIYDSIAKKVQFATGGTNSLYHYNAKMGSFENITKSFEPVGVEKTTVYSDIEMKVDTGDIILMSTDGLIESLNDNGVQYSQKNLERIVKESHNLSGKDIANKVKTDVVNFCGGTVQYDDRSLLVIKVQ